MNLLIYYMCIRLPIQFPLEFDCYAVSIKEINLNYKLVYGSLVLSCPVFTCKFQRILSCINHAIVSLLLCGMVWNKYYQLTTTLICILATWGTTTVAFVLIPLGLPGNEEQTRVTFLILVCTYLYSYVHSTK